MDNSGSNTSHDHLVDAFKSPLDKTGEVKSKEQAIADGDWMKGLHIWLYRPGDEPAVFCQLRGAGVYNGPGLLDSTAAGHYEAGESETDGLRELREETGLRIPPSQFTKWGTRLYIGLYSKGRERRAIVDVFTAPFAGDLQSFKLQPEELDGMFMLPMSSLLDVFNRKIPSFTAYGIDSDGKELAKVIAADSFPHTLDNDHWHMVEHLAIKAGVLK